MRKRILLFVSIMLVTSAVFCQSNPIQVALITPVQIVPEDQGISGLRLNFIYGKNTFVRGIDLGLINQTTSGQSVGFQYGVVGLNNNFLGVQLGGANITSGEFEGFQWGAVNYAGNANGLQLGIVNYAGTLKGLQVGLINIINNGGQFPFMALVNWSF